MPQEKTVTKPITTFDPKRAFTILNGPGLDTAQTTPAPPNPLQQQSVQFPEFDPETSGLTAEDQSWLGSIKNFGVNYWNTVNPYPMLKSIYEAAPFTPMVASEGDPTGVKGKIAAQKRLVEGILGPSWEQLQKGKKAYDEGRYTEAVGHTLGAIPLIGPTAAHAGEQFAEGDFSGGLGTTAGILTPFAMRPALRGSGTVVRKAGEALADRGATALERSADARMADVLAPKSGSNKVRLGNAAAEVAPTVVRDPRLNVSTRAELQAGIGEILDEARGKVEEVFVDAAAQNKFLKTTPIVKRLQDRLRELTIEGKDGAVVKPASRQAEMDALTQAIEEVRGLGNDVSPYELHKLTQSWRDAGKPASLPSVAADATKQSSTAARGYLTAVESVEQYMGQRVKGLAKPLAQQQLWQKAADVMEAAEEASRSRTGAVRKAVESGVGAWMGHHMTGTHIGATVGAMILPLLDSAATGGITSQIGVARFLAKAADHLKKGDIAKFGNSMEQAFTTAGKPITQEMKDSWSRARRLLQ